MISTLLRGSLRRRPAQLGLIFAAVLTAAAAAAVLGAFSARSSARFAEDLRGFGPNLVVRPQVGGPRTLAFEEAERIAAVPFVLAAAPILESDQGGRLEVTSTSALLALHPSWRLVGSWPGSGEVALGSGADAALAGTAAVSGRLETGDRYDGAIFRPLLASPPAVAGPGLSRVEVRAAPEHLSEVVARIGATVAGAEALPLVRVSEAEAALTRRLRLLLGTLGGLSLALALLAVAGASAALLGERRAEIGLMLALGYTPHRIAAAQAGELAAVGATAALLGAVLGEWAAQGLAARVLGSAPSASARLSWTAGGMGAAGVAAALVVGAGALVIVYRLSRLDAGDLLRGD